MKKQNVKKAVATLLAVLLTMSILLMQGCSETKKKNYDYDPLETYTPPVTQARPTSPAPTPTTPAPSESKTYIPPSITPIDGVPIVSGYNSTPSDTETPSDTDNPADTETPSVTDAPPETEAPETEAPETEAPETEAPETEAPETEAPETEAPETEPVTEPPVSYHLDLLYEEVTFYNSGESCYLLSPDSNLPPDAITYWYSSDEAVATVTNGMVTAVGSGTAVITADCEGYSDSCTVYCSFENVQSEVQPYYDVLAEYLDNQNARFVLANVDGDGVPELIIAPDSFHMVGVVLYTIQNGQAVLLQECGAYGEMLYSPWNHLFGDYDFYVSHYYTFYTILDGSVSVLATFRCGPETMESEEITYQINNDYVTEEEYETALTDLLANGFYWIGHPDGFRITEENLNSLLVDPDSYYAYGRPFTRDTVDWG